MLSGDFHTNYAIRNVMFKRHASCFETHPAIDAALELRDKADIEDISEVHIKAVPVAVEIAGKPKPQTGLEGKFSIAFCVALALADGQTGEEFFTDENVQSEHLVSLREKIKVEASEEFGITQAEVVIRMRDGRELKTRADTFELGADKERRKADLVKKFRSFADRLLPEGRADAILQFVNEIETRGYVSELAALCCP